MAKAQTKAKNKWNKNNTTAFTFRFNNEADADVIETLQASDNKSGLIKSLIRENIKKDQST